MVDLVKQVALSWQVIAITIAIFLFLSLVSHVAKAYHRPRVKKVKVPKQKAAVPAASDSPEEAMASGDSNEDLGLEEA